MHPALPQKPRQHPGSDEFVRVSKLQLGNAAVCEALLRALRIAKQSLADKCVPKHRDWVIMTRISRNTCTVNCCASPLSPKLSSLAMRGKSFCRRRWRATLIEANEEDQSNPGLMTMSRFGFSSAVFFSLGRGCR